jgi:hypothetical protein
LQELSGAETPKETAVIRSEKRQSLWEQPMGTLILIFGLLTAACAALAESPGDGPPIPAQARAVGYTLNTFSANRNFNTSTADMSRTYSSGFQWYIWNFFGPPPSSSTTTLNADGSATILSSAYNGTLVSAAKIPSSPYYVGTAFGGGGYFEAEISFDSAAVNMKKGHPSFWTMAIEHLDGDHGDQWAGQAAGYVHYLEMDIFEYDSLGGSAPNNYGAAAPEYWGGYGLTCPPSSCRNVNASAIFTPPGTDWSLWHKVGLLWIPATSTTNGTLTFYFDDIPYKTLKYSQFTTQPPVPTRHPWALGIVDQQHFPLIIGSGPDTPINVRSVNVWQATAANNITN